MAKKTNSVVIDKLNELIGIDAARNLALIYGGVEFWFCEGDACIKRLTLIVGAENARKLIAEYKDIAISIPLYAHVIRKERNEAIKADLDAGMSHRDVGLKHETTERNVRLIWAAQADLRPPNRPTKTQEKRK